jgi:hypothetical protein
MTKQVIRQTETLCVYKVWGSGDTITLATDLLSPTMELSGTPVPKVNIIAVTWSVSAGGSDQVAIVRNSVPILNLYQNGQLDLGGNYGHVDTISNTSNIVVTITGTGQVFLTLRKVEGYRSFLQPETYSVYDNPAVSNG